MTTDAEALSVHNGGGVRILPGVATLVRDDTVLASEFGEELLDYVLKARPDA
jgi:hypothetical protein